MDRGFVAGSLVCALMTLGAVSGCERPPAQSQGAADEMPTIPAGAEAVPVEDMDEITTPVSGIPDRLRVVIRHETTWAAYWNDFHANVVPVPDLPSVDFTTQMVVAATMGTRPSGGYTVSVSAVYRHEGTLFVRVRQASPEPTCLNTAVMTAPAVAVVTDRWKGPLEFVEESATNSC
jgi:hypothetical protein